MAEDTRLRDRLTRDRILLAAVLVVGIAGTGIVRRQLGLLGYNDLGRLVFVLGYGGTVFVVWYGWIRPLDITGPSAGGGASRTYGKTEGEADDSRSEPRGSGTDGHQGPGTDPDGDGNSEDGAATDDADR